MDYSAGSYDSSWPVHSASESYSFADASVEPYAVEGSVPPSSYFMRTTSDHNLTFSELERNSTVLSNGCLPYDAQADLLSSEFLSKDKLPNSLLELQQLQNNIKRQSNVVTPGVLQCNSPPGMFRSQLDTAGLAELPHTLSSSIDSNGSEVSAFLPDVHAVSSDSTLCSTFENGSSFMEPVNLGGFSFEGAQKDVILNKTGHPNGNISVFDNAAALASLQDSKDFIGGSLSSFATVQERNLTGSGFRPQKQEQNAVCNIPVPTFMPHNQMAVTDAQGAQIPPKISSTIHSSKNECPVSHSSDVLALANSANGNGVGVKPRVRARRGQATDPHSIAERLRREKISERMKRLQDLVPNSNKADKSSMLDEIIDYVKFLQLQVKVLSMSRLGAPGAVLPLLAESQTEARSNQSQSASTITQGLVDIQDDSEDSIAFDEEVVKLMETSITNAMQYLQNKGLCLMPIALASAISTQKGVAGAAIPHER